VLASVDFPVPSQVVRLGSQAAGLVGGWMGLLTDLTRRHQVFDRWWSAEAAVTATVGEVLPLLRLEHGRGWPSGLRGLAGRASLADMTVLRPLSEPVRAARALLQEGFTSGLSMDDVARAVCLSPAQFFSSFRSQMGKTPLAYRDSLRVQFMCHLLAGTDLPVGEIKRMAGWDDADTAGRVFKSAVSMSPSAWRAKFGVHLDSGVVLPADCLVFEQ
jgi:AraC-like DNA-binding protein